jgi:cytochrome c556
MGRIFRTLCVSALLSVPLLAVASDQDTIRYREDVMKTLNEQAGVLGEMLSGAVPNDNYGAQLQAFALTASTALKAFESKVPGGKAKPAVWASWTDFSKRMTEFAQQAAAAAKTAKEQGNDAAAEDLIDATESCKSCHKQYRQEMKGDRDDQ